MRVTVTERHPRDHKPQALLLVEDNGIGISPAEVDRLFERFYRGKEARMASSGSGLGLSITRSVAEQHGGSISASSEQGTGSRFTVVLPLADTAALPLLRA